MKSRLEELIWIEEILIELKSRYPEHNASILEDLIYIIKYREECETKQSYNKVYH